MAQVVSCQVQDVDEHAQALNGFRQNYEQLGRGRFQGRVWQLLLDQGFILRESANRSLRQRFSPPPEHLALAVPLTVAPGAVFAGQPLRRDGLVVVDGSQEYELVSAGELDVIGLSVHRDLIAAQAPQLQEWLQGAQAARHLALRPEAAQAIRQMLLGLSQQAQGQSHKPLQAQGPAAGALHASTLRDETAWLSATLAQTLALAMAGSGALGKTDVPRRARTRQKVVQRAVAFMQAHLHDDLDVPQICAAACASRRNLQYCFEELLRTTPQAYLRALRLNAARRALNTAHPPPITALASTLRFASSSHFSQQYRLMFDEPPSATLRAGAQRQRPAAG